MLREGVRRTVGASAGEPQKEIMPAIVNIERD